MKEFFKYTFATVVGIIIVALIFGIMGVASIVGMLASEQSTQSVQDNSVFVLSLSGNIQERASQDVVSELTGNVSDNLGLDDILSSIKKAKDNENIKGIYMEAGMLVGTDPASLQAIRKALVDFKKSGKWIIAYGDIYTEGCYYLCSAADKVYIDTVGRIDWHGLSSQPYFLKDMMAKFGVKMQVAKVGTYKSMPETYTADKMSDANRQQVTDMLTSIWGQMCHDVSASRHIPVKALNDYADRLITFAPSEDYLKYKMVDGIIYSDSVKSIIKNKLKIDKDKDINQLTLAEMKNVKTAEHEGDKIAVYYAYGSMVMTASTDITSDNNGCIAADDVCKDLESLADDDDVKAVVLRINSGGGSAYAAEQIWHSVMMLKAKKPVVVSMSGMAASAAYYISAPANWIVAEPTTLTGSIGIFGMFPDFSGLLTDKLGVKFDEVNTNKDSGFGTTTRPFTPEEMSYINSYIDRGYKLFRGRVAEGRKMKVNDVENSAHRGIWLGKDAIGIKLVDQLGDIDAAIAKAAKLAKLGKDYYTSSYPAPESWYEQLLNNKKGSYLDEQMHATLGELYTPFMMLKNMNRENAIQARITSEVSVK